MSKKFSQFDNNLHILAEDITRAIHSGEQGVSQKDHVEELIQLEDKFRKSIVRFTQAREVYKKFIIMVVVKNRNILSARPFFREKSDVFVKEITPAIKDGNIRKLKKFHINFNLIKFIRENWLGPFPKNSQKIYDRIVQVRTSLVQNNMPLAINRAKRFYRKTPRSHLNLMDLVGIAAMGLISGIDKYIGAYTKVFNGVCIGYMTGNMIDSYSQTELHFYPSDRSILYRANALRYKLGTEDMNVLAEAINSSYVEDRKNGVRTPKESITASELSNLLRAASPVSSDITLSDNDSSDSESANSGKFRGYDNVSHEGTMVPDTEELPTPEDEAERKDSKSKMLTVARMLPVLQRKVLRLKGVKI